MDFILFTGEEAKMKEDIMAYTINLPASVETLREYCGVSATNLMKLCAAVRDLLQQNSESKQKPTAEEVTTWLNDPAKIK